MKYDPKEFKKQKKIMNINLTVASWLGTILGLSITILLILLVISGIVWCIRFLGV